jgi:hypothetical protein
MDSILLTITGISLALAVGMGVVLFLRLRDERQRSDARVALLAAATQPAGSLERFADPSEWSESRTSADSEQAGARDGLFTVPETASPWRGRLTAAGALALLLAAIGLGLRAGSATPIGGNAGAPPILPLELMELRHTVEERAMTITGIVQNPRGGTRISQVLATASLFGSDGTLLASGHAGLDYVTLAPGTESPFVIKIPVTATVSRYRVGFRGPDGAVIAHVDRRAGGTAARNERLSERVTWLR